MSSSRTNFWVILFFLLLASGCGVKGDPLPPKNAPRLGRGHPTYTKASRQVTPDYKNTDEASEETDQEK